MHYSPLFFFLCVFWYMGQFRFGQASQIIGLTRFPLSIHVFNFPFSFARGVMECTLAFDDLHSEFVAQVVN